jgi:hypothetical protein
MHIGGSITMTPELNTARGKKKINKQLKKKTLFFTENKTLFASILSTTNRVLCWPLFGFKKLLEKK